MEDFFDKERAQLRALQTELDTTRRRLKWANGRALFWAAVAGLLGGLLCFS